jgi:hypothetical protein
MRRDARRSAAAIILRAKVVLTAMAFAAAVVSVTVASWPLKALVGLAFVRGLLASDLVKIRNAPRLRSPKPAPPPASSDAAGSRAAVGQGSALPAR